MLGLSVQPANSQQRKERKNKAPARTVAAARPTTNPEIVKDVAEAKPNERRGKVAEYRKDKDEAAAKAARSLAVKKTCETRMHEAHHKAKISIQAVRGTLTDFQRVSAELTDVTKLMAQRCEQQEIDAKEEFKARKAYREAKHISDQDQAALKGAEMSSVAAHGAKQAMQIAEDQAAAVEPVAPPPPALPATEVELLQRNLATMQSTLARLVAR